MPKIAIVIVTYNSQLHLPKAMECVQNQTMQPSQIVLVDSGSSDTTYLQHYQSNPLIEIIYEALDVGFCVGNNKGYAKIHPDTGFVFFLNPDAFLTEDFLEQAIRFMNEPQHMDCGALTGIVLKYDIQQDRPLSVYDSTGVFHTWYGRWYDRAQGTEYHPEHFKEIESIPAICGAVLFCRKTALDSVLLPGNEVFNSHFHMYKEDIELSIRLRQNHWKLYFHPQLLAYHCRGWAPRRKDMPRKMRLYSAKNELRINTRSLFSFEAFYSLLKYISVKIFNM